VTDQSDIVGVAVDYPQLRALISARRRELGLRQLEVDDLAGLQGGYTGKLECGDRHFGDMSLGSVLGALGVGLQLVLPAGKHESLDDKAKASVEKRIARQKKFSALGNAARSKKLSSSKRRDIARKAAIARWKAWKPKGRAPRPGKPRSGISIG
jgi:hypothetical protein